MLVSRLLLFVLCICLAGCGFRPLYGDASAGSPAKVGLLARIAIDPIAGRSGQIFRNQLIDRLQPRGLAKDPQYRLSVGLDEQRVELGVRKDQSASRATLRLRGDWVLSRLADGEVLASGAARSIVSYNILESQFGTIVSSDNALERGLADLAQDLQLQLALKLDQDLLDSPVRAVREPALPTGL